MVDKSSIIPQGATHRYEHGCLISWYRETTENLFVWRDGSWHGSAFKSAEQLMESCPLGKLTMLMAEQDDPVEDDLTWLARNVHKWPVSAEFAVRPGMGKVLFFEHHYSHLLQFSREQWLARRAELQSKPSWETSPEWAQWLAQDDSGKWYWYASKPTHPGMKSWWPAPGAENVQCGKGEVLGGWRDTLERRPEGFKPFTSIEDNQEKVMKQDNGWHERGELPPVGTKCEYRLSTSAPWYPCEIKYVIHDDGVVMMREDGFEQFCSINSKLQPVSFRPIRTERDALIEVITAGSNFSKDGAVIGRIADAILAAWFKRG